MVARHLTLKNKVCWVRLTEGVARSIKDLTERKTPFAEEQNKYTESCAGFCSLAAEKKNTRAAWVGKPPMGKLPKYAGLAEW